MTLSYMPPAFDLAASTSLPAHLADAGRVRFGAGVGKMPRRG
jgi:hypothetical protein